MIRMDLWQHTKTKLHMGTQGNVVWWCRYNAVNFLTNIHKGHPIARPLGCSIWLIFCLCSCHYSCNIFTILDRVITALDCIMGMCVFMHTFKNSLEGLIRIIPLMISRVWWYFAIKLDALACLLELNRYFCCGTNHRYSKENHYMKPK